MGLMGSQSVRNVANTEGREYLPTLSVVLAVLIDSLSRFRLLLLLLACWRECFTIGRGRKVEELWID